MYRRYSQDMGGTEPRFRRRIEQIKSILILVLIAAVAALCIIMIPQVKNQQSEYSLLIQRMQSECDEAVRQTAGLSRNAGADSAAILAKVRCNIYSVRLLNNLASAQGKGQPVSEETLMELQNTIDRYLSFLTTGMDTGEYQTNLQNGLISLQNLVNELR